MQSFKLRPIKTQTVSLGTNTNPSYSTSLPLKSMTILGTLQSFKSNNFREGLAKVFTYNLYEGYILDNTPLETLLGQYFQRMGYKKLGDLYLPTSITVVNQSSGLDMRLWSTDPAYQDLDLLEVVMASACRKIQRNFTYEN
jgi:hypothetical protein